MVIGAFSLLLLILPPRHSIGPVLSVVGLLFLALAAAAFLPAPWFGVPDWRVALTKDLGIQLPGTVSPQPWLTLDSFFVLIAGLAWIYYVTIFDAPLREIRVSARLFSAGMILVAALSIFLYLKHMALPSWHNARGFGPFPNRNQTGDLFGISAVLVLGCMQDDFRRGHKRWMLWIPGLGVLSAALVLAYSRAGILILVVGFAAWLIRFAFRKWSGAGLAIAAAPLLLLFAGLLLFGGETIERFHLRLGSEGSVTSDYRWLIFRDTWAMIKNTPWCGVGLGNFENVFALFRHASRGVTRSLHPESDWLWLWAEMGWPALLLILVAAVIFVRRAFPLKEGTNQRLRYTALVGALLFALHGFVDVSAHRFASFMAGTFLLGIAQARPVTRKPSRWSPILFRFIGLILALVSAAWFLGWRSQWPLPGRVGVENARQSIPIANRGHRFNESIAMADQALKWAPLDWQLYFLRAVSRIGKRELIADAVADFRRARFLEPSAYQVPYEEGRAWLGWQPALAITAWREALQREGAREVNIYPRMLTDATNYDAKVHEALRDFARHRPALTINYLEDANPTEFAATMRTVLADDPTLEEFTPAQKARLFQLWSRHDPLDELLHQIELHPDWLQYAWPGVARHRAELGEFGQAWQLVRQYAAPPALPELTGDQSIEDLEQEHIANPEDIAIGYALYQAQMKAAKIEAALDTARHFTARPEAPDYFRYLEAQAWAAEGNWERAWRCWQDYQSRRSERR